MRVTMKNFVQWVAPTLLMAALLWPAAAIAEPRKAEALSPVSFRSEAAKHGAQAKGAVAVADRQSPAPEREQRDSLANLGKDSKIFDEGFFPITQDTLDVTDPRMAAGTDAWFIAAQRAFPTDHDIVGLIVPFVDADPIALNVDATENIDSYLPAVAFGPDLGLFFVVWEDFEAVDRNIYGAFVNESGEKVSDSFPVAETVDEEFSPSVVYAGLGDFLVFYGAADDISLETGTFATYATRVNVAENGDIASADRVLVADGGAYPRAAQVNEDYVVVAYQQLFERNSGAQAAWDWDTAVSTVTYEGIPVGEPSLLSATTASETYPSVAYNPEDGVAVVAYEYYEGDGDDRDIDIAVLNVNNLGVLGTPVASNVFDSPTFDGWTDLAWDGVNGAFLLTWQHDFVDTTAQTVDGDIYALELDALGNPVGGAQGAIETEAEEMLPAVAALDGVFLVSWQALFDGVFNLEGRLYSAGYNPGSGRVLSIPEGLVPNAGVLQAPVNVDEASGVLSFKVAVCYPAELDFVSATAGTLDSTWNIIANDNGGTVVVSGAGTTELSGAGSLVKLRFSVPASSKGGALTFCESGENNLNDGHIIIAAPVPGSYTAATPSFTWGDLGTASGDTPFVACDAIAGGLDAALMLRWDVGLATRLVACPSAQIFMAPAFPPGGDVNSDGILGGLDASLVLRYDAGIINCFPADSDCNGLGPKWTEKQATGTRTVELADGVLLPDVGQSVAVPVTIDDATDLLSYRLEVSFPSDRLAFDRAEASALTSGWLGPVVNVVNGMVILSSSGAEAAMGSGALVTLYFEVTSTSGGTALRFGPETRLNDGTVPVVTENGSVSPGTTAYEVSPSGSIDFGVLTTGESATRTLTVRNTGNATLEGHAEVTGQSFSLVSAPSFTLAPNATTMVTVRFAPGANGDFTGALRLSGATSAEIQVTLKGSAAANKILGCAPGGGGPASSRGDLAMLAVTALALGYFMRRRRIV